MTEIHTNAPRPAKEITGRIVLLCLLGFFGVVVAVNAVMIRAATTTFGGVETASAYKVGLAFNHEIAAGHAQEARHWSVNGKLAHNAVGEATLSVTVRDRNGAPPPAIALTARLLHPADTRRDHAIAVRQIAPGVFHGDVHADAGQWDLRIDITRDGEQLFRSKSRVTLR